MRPHRAFLVIALVQLSVAVMAAAAPVAAASPGLRLGSGFTFHGRLEQSAAPAQGRYDFELELYDQREGGTLLGQQTVFDAPVTHGAFDLELDFGRAVVDLPGAWLEIHVRESGFDAFTTLAPRQAVSATSTTTCTIDDLVVEGKAGIGMTTLPLTSTLEVRGAESNGTSTAPLQVRSTAGGFTQQLFLDGDEIDSYSVGGVGPLGINANVSADVNLVLGGGDVGVGIYDPAARLHVTGGTDAEPGSGGFLVLGDVGAGNVALDNNEIMARNNGATSTLFLNNDGGDVKVGGTLDVGYELVVASGCNGNYSEVACSAGKKVIGGGCQGFTLGESRPGGISSTHDAGWNCFYEDGCTSYTRAIAICARVK